MNTVKEVEFDKRNSESLEIAQEIYNLVKNDKNVIEVFALVRIGPDYHRFSTTVRDTTDLIATLEIAKFDCLTRMLK